MPTADSTVKTSVSKGQCIIYSANGLTLVQTETVTITEYRAESETSAAALVSSLYSDDSGTATLYHTTGGGCAIATVKTGSITTAAAHRANEAGFWTVVATKTEYDHVGSDNSWTTSHPAAGNGFTSSQSVAKRILAGGDGNPLRETETVTTTEWRNLTAAQVATLISGLPNDTMSEETWHRTHLATEVEKCVVMVGDRYARNARFVSETEGWTLTQTLTNLAVSGSNWSRVT